MESRRETVINNHYAGCNCAQSVFAAYYDIFGGIENRDTALKLALSFGGGLARTQGVCGAVCGSTMLLGLKYGPVNGPNGDEVWAYHNKVRDFMKDFEDINGSIYCKYIIRCDITTPEGYGKAHDNLENYCVKAVLSSVDLLEGKYGILEELIL